MPSRSRLSVLHSTLVVNPLTIFRDSNPETDVAAVAGQIELIRTGMGKVGTIKRNVTAIREHAGNIQDEVAMVQSEVRGALVAIDVVLRTAARATPPRGAF